MSEFAVKISCLAVLLGIFLSLLRDGGVKNYAKIGLGLVFTVCIVTSLLNFIVGDAGLDGSSGGISKAIEGKLRNALLLAEISGGENSDSSSAIMNEYKLRLKAGAEKEVLSRTGYGVSVAFAVCEDSSSADYGQILHVHCRVIGKGNLDEQEEPVESIETQKPLSDKIEITAEGIFINGVLIGGDSSKDDYGEGGAEDGITSEEREQATVKIQQALVGFCGVTAEQCSIHWEV